MQKIIKAFNQGKIIVFPTDTVWGIGCSLSFPQSIKRLYKIKGRLETQPTAVLVSSFAKAEKLGKFSAKLKKTAKKFWPGPLTLIVPATSKVPPKILGHHKTVGLRIPQHAWLLKLLAKIPLGIVASSANFAGKQAPLKKTMLDPTLIKQIDLVVSGVKAQGQSASTVIKAKGNLLKILRQGKISRKEINDFLETSS